LITTDCLVPGGYKDRGGYGFTKVNGKTTRAHRQAYKEAYGEIPVGLYICHKCNNPGCINPEHLYAGTPTQNMDDRRRAGRDHGWESYPKHGTKNPNVRLTKEDVLYIRSNRKYGMGKQLALKFGVSISLVRKIWSGVLWPSVLSA
jgi:hypothetical protein